MSETEIKRGVGRPPKFTAKQIQSLRDQRKDGATYAELARHLGVSRQWARRLCLTPNPFCEDRLWRCAECGNEKVSKARFGPNRCTDCGGDSFAMIDGEQPEAEIIEAQIAGLQSRLARLRQA